MKRRIHLTFLFCVLAVLFAVPVLSALEPDEETSFYENRALTQRPAWSMEGMMEGEYFTQWESYLSDHIVRRDWWLKAYTVEETVLLRREVVNDVVLGQDVLLPYMTQVDEVDYTAQAQQMAGDLAALQQVIADNGGVFLYIGVPEQYSYFRDRYPDYLFNNDANLTHLHQQFAQALEEQGVAYLDILPVLKEDENSDSYYFRTDHHYTIRGALRTWQAAVEQLQTLGVDVTAVDEEEVEFVSLPNPFYGSRGRKLYDTSPVSDTLEIWRGAWEQVPFTRYDNGAQVESTLFTLPGNDEEAVAYTAYMGGDQAETRIETDRPELPDALIFGDSFTNALETFAFLSFDTTVSLDLRHYTQQTLAQYIAEYQPDVVICIRDDTSFVNFEGNGQVAP